MKTMKYISRTILFILIVTLGLIACSNNDTYYNLNGRWEGEHNNNSTSQDWPFKIYLEHRHNDITGVYSDYRGNITLRNIVFDGENISFLIDLWPETVTFVGKANSETSVSGSWSYSGDGNNGSWYMLKDRDPEEEGDEEEDSSSSQDTNHLPANPFAAQQ